MPEKCKVITFGKINRNIIILFLGGLIYTGQLCLETESEIFGNDKKNPYPVVYTAMYSLSLCLAGIILLVYNIRNKRNQVSSNLINNVILEKQNSNKIKTISWKKKLLWISLVSFIDFTSFVFSSYFWTSNENYINTLQLNIVFMAIFAYFTSLFMYCCYCYKKYIISYSFYD